MHILPDVRLRDALAFVARRLLITVVVLIAVTVTMWRPLPNAPRAHFGVYQSSTGGAPPTVQLADGGPNVRCPGGSTPCP